jgi:hypothetical protein
MTREFERDPNGLPARPTDPRYKTYWLEELGWDSFMRISLDLNVLRDRVVPRCGFVNYIHNCLNSSPSKDFVKDLEDRIHRFRQGGPVTLFLP